MKMCFEDAFTFVAADSQYKRKLAVGALLSILWVVLLFVPFSAVFMGNIKISAILFLFCYFIDFLVFLYLVGYTYCVANNRINNNEQILPCWCEFKKIFFTGVKASMGYLIFSVPLYIALSVIFLMFFGISFLPDGAVSVLFSCVFVVALLGILCLSVFYTLGCYLMMAVFSGDLKILSFIDFKSAYYLIKENWVNYLILLLLVIAVGIVLQIAAAVLMCTIIGIIFIPPLCFYSGLVTMDLIAQFAKTKALNE